MKEIQTPCPSCTQLWCPDGFRARFLPSSGHLIHYEKKTYGFFHHPACSSEHKKIVPAQNLSGPSIFSPVKALECIYSKELNLYFSNAEGVFFLDKDNFVILSGQGRSVLKQLSLQKAVFELLERMANVFLPEDILKTESLPGINNKNEKCQIPVLDAIPSGIYGKEKNDLPLHYGIAIHTDKEEAEKNATLECIEKREQYHSLRGQALEELTPDQYPNDVKSLLNFLCFNEGQLKIFVRRMKSVCFVATILKRESHPFRLLTSCANHDINKAIIHSLHELCEKYIFLNSPAYKEQKHDSKEVPWIEFAENKDREELEIIFQNGKMVFNGQYGNLIKTNRNNLLTEQLGLYVSQVFYPELKRDPIELEFFPYG